MRKIEDYSLSVRSTMKFIQMVRPELRWANVVGPYSIHYGDIDAEDPMEETIKILACVSKKLSWEDRETMKLNIKRACKLDWGEHRYHIEVLTQEEIEDLTRSAEKAGYRGNDQQLTIFWSRRTYAYLLVENSDVGMPLSFNIDKFVKDFGYLFYFEEGAVEKYKQTEAYRREYEYRISWNKPVEEVIKEYHMEDLVEEFNQGN